MPAWFFVGRLCSRGHGCPRSCARQGVWSCGTKGSQPGLVTPTVAEPPGRLRKEPVRKGGRQMFDRRNTTGSAGCRARCIECHESGDSSPCISTASATRANPPSGDAPTGTSLILSNSTRKAYQSRLGPLRPVIPQVVHKFLDCGNLDRGFARVRCDHCRHEALLASARAPPDADPGPWTREPCDDVDPRPDYENVLTD